MSAGSIFMGLLFAALIISLIATAITNFRKKRTKQKTGIRD